MNKFNLCKKKKQLKERLKKGLDETPIIEKLEDHYNLDLSNYYGSPEKVNNLFNKLGKIEGVKCR